MEIKQVGVLGCGLMGHGIAQVAAQAGYEVVVREVDQAKLDKGIAKIEKQLARAVEKGRMEQGDADAVRGRITGTLDYSDLAGCDLVIEAITEDLGLKLEMWREVDQIAKPEAVFATNTSSLPVIDQAAATSRPERFLGLHYFNPAQVMKLVEIVSTISTAPDVAATAHAVSAQLGKHAVSCTDRAGFIVNALLFPYLNDAVKMLEAHYATADDIDAAMKVGCGYPMGPFELLDVVGLDVSLAIEKELYIEFREPGFAPAPLLEHLVTAGYLGRKTGRGFRDYAGR